MNNIMRVTLADGTFIGDFDLESSTDSPELVAFIDSLRKSNKAKDREIAAQFDKDARFNRDRIIEMLNKIPGLVINFIDRDKDIL